MAPRLSSSQVLRERAKSLRARAALARTQDQREDLLQDAREMDDLADRVIRAHDRARGRDGALAAPATVARA